MSTEYHKIETLFERDKETFKVFPDKLRNSVYGMLKSWQFTEKIDGTNIRIIWEDKKFSVGGKTDNAQIPADLVNHLYDTVDTKKLEEVFPDSDAVIYGEGYGAGIQKGSGYSMTKQFIVFDVKILPHAIEQSNMVWWLNWENTCDISNKLGLKTVPFIGDMSLEQAVDMVRGGFDSILARENTGQVVKAEGLVGRPVETLYDKKGSRVIIKLKTKDF